MNKQEKNEILSFEYDNTYYNLRAYRKAVKDLLQKFDEVETSDDLTILMNEFRVTIDALEAIIRVEKF